MSKTGIRTAVMGSLEAPLWLSSFVKRWPVRRMTDCGVILRWAMCYGMSSRRKKVPVDVQGLVVKWIDAVVGMCLAHDKDAYDSHDAKADELLTPLMAAPVKQVREFYAALVAAMEADKRVPFIVVQGFVAWGEVMVKDAPDEKVKRLKRQLASDIADLCEEPIRDQIPNALKRALMWRDEDTLKAVKSTLQSGVKPKLEGRQSCLFLVAGRGKNKVRVML